MADRPEGGFGIYFHWPFCQAKCPYCDFNSHIRREVDHDRWRQALLSDLRRQARGLDGRHVDSIFFGGGTPSLMEPETVSALIEEVRRLWPGSAEIEISLEANPTSVEARRFAGYAAAGVNRLSLGVQALNDADLKRLGRLHSAREAREAFAIARDHIDRVSFDLIYARLDQTLADWQAELTAACQMAVDHLSLYQLTIEPGTRFGDLHRLGRLQGLPQDDLSADLYEMTQDICGAAGLTAYEVSNHARAGAECAHNLVYWRYGDYLGVGPGAHGRISRNQQRLACEAVSNPERWLTETEAGKETATEDISALDQANEYLLMGLRLREGISLNRFVRFGAGELDEQILEALHCDDRVVIDGETLRVTEHGRLVLNYIIGQLAL